MNRYVPAAEARALYDDSDQLRYSFPVDEPTYLQAEGLPEAPQEMVREALAFMPPAPGKVLELGCGRATDSLHLAALGYMVLAVDDNRGYVAWSNNMARRLGLQRNFTALHRDVREMTLRGQYDMVLAINLLHFLDKSAGVALVTAMKRSTMPGGLNVVTAYTDDNPAKEAERGVRYMLEPGKLQTLYPRSGWAIQRNKEGTKPPVTRNKLVGEGMSLIPTMAEIIARRRRQTPLPLYNGPATRRGRMGDALGPGDELFFL